MSFRHSAVVFSDRMSPLKRPGRFDQSHRSKEVDVAVVAHRAAVVAVAVVSWHSFQGRVFVASASSTIQNIFGFVYLYAVAERRVTETRHALDRYSAITGSRFFLLMSDGRAWTGNFVTDTRCYVERFVTSLDCYFSLELSLMQARVVCPRLVTN